MGITVEAAQEINERLTALYPGRWQESQNTALMEEFEALVSDAEILEAVRRHVHDTQAGRDGLPIGHWPPTVADLERQLQLIYVERLQDLQEERQRQIYQEKDDTYETILGRRAPRNQRVKFWVDLGQVQLRRSQEIRQALQQRYFLDYNQNITHRYFLMTVLDIARYGESGQPKEEAEIGQVGLLPVERTLQIAEKIAYSMGLEAANQDATEIQK